MILFSNHPLTQTFQKYEIKVSFCVRREPVAAKKNNTDYEIDYPHDFTGNAAMQRCGFWSKD